MKGQVDLVDRARDKMDCPLGAPSNRVESFSVSAGSQGCVREPFGRQKRGMGCASQGSRKAPDAGIASLVTLGKTTNGRLETASLASNVASMVGCMGRRLSLPYTAGVVKVTSNVPDL